MHIPDRSLLALLFLLLWQAPIPLNPAIAQGLDNPTAAVKAAVGTKVKIDGSGSVAAVNRALTDSFVREGGSVDFGVSGTAQGLQALLDGKVDLAAIGRPLTNDEKAQGLMAIPIKREKIAMIVGSDNPYDGNMTIDQFAKLFRGEVTDWSQVGGASGPVRFIDQPEASDTRSALQNYPTFKTAPFQNGSTTTRVSDEKAESLGSTLGKDGISYVLADQARTLPGTKIVTMHKTQPDDPRYPFSHALYYVYKKGNVTPAAKALLTHAAGAEGQAALAAVSVKDGLLPIQGEVAQAIAEPGTAPTSPTASPTASPVASPTASPAASAAPASAAPASPEVATAIAPTAATGDTGIPPWLWLPLILGAGGLLWALLKRPKGGSTPVGWDDTKARSTPATGGAAGGAAAVGKGLAMGAGAAGVGAVVAGTDDIANDVAQRASDRTTSDAANAGPTEAETQETLALETPAATIPSPGVNPAVLGAGAIAGGAALGAALSNKPTEAPTPFTPITQLPAQDTDPNLPVVETPAAATAAVSVETTDPIEAAIAPIPDEAPRASGLDPATLAVATGAVAAAAIAPTFFVENPNVDDSPRSAQSTPPTPVSTVIESNSDNASSSDTSASVSNPAIGAAIATGAVLATTAPKLDFDGVDNDLPDLPDGYGESRIVLMARDPQWAYAYWDIPNDHRQALRDQGGQQLALRFYDVTDLDINQSRPHSVQQYGLEEMTRDWYLPIPVSDRDYMAEVGYTTATGSWLMLARSNSVRIPPVYPSDEVSDQFVTIPWTEDLQGKAIPLPGKAGTGPVPIHQQLYEMGMPGTAESRVAGSIGGDSSFVFPSGSGFETLDVPPFGAWTASGSGMGLTMSGAGLTMSGVGFGSFQPPTNKPRNFWLVADAELIVYGATEPDATLTINGEPVQLSPDGTFRIQMSFQDGQLHFPVMAVAADGEQMRNITLNFNRSTPARRTNTKAEAQDEWPDA